MSKKFYINLIFLAAMVGFAWYNYDLTQTGQYESARRDPLLMILVSFAGMLYAIFGVIVEILKVVYADNEKAMSRLNGDFWTILLGPVRKDL